MSSEMEEIVAGMVRASYKVITDNIQHGRGVADQFQRGQFARARLPDDAADIARRATDLAMKLAAAWMDLVGATMRDPVLQDVLKPAGPRPETPVPSAPVATPPIAYRTTGKTCEVSLNLQNPIGNKVLPVVSAVHHTHGNHPPIRGAQLLAAADRKGLVLHVAVPPDQPHGDYAGVLLDEGGRPIGTLHVRVVV